MRKALRLKGGCGVEMQAVFGCSNPLKSQDPRIPEARGGRGHVQPGPGPEHCLPESLLSTLEKTLLDLVRVWGFGV